MGKVNKLQYINDNMSRKNSDIPPPPPQLIRQQFGGRILIIDWNVVGKCDTTPRPFFRLFAMALH
jgi:hypothetical protein